jgi:hypothetical protein
MHLIESRNIVKPGLWPAGSPDRIRPFHYKAYGLSIQSDLPLPEFLPGAGPRCVPDVLVTLGREEDWTGDARGERSFRSINAGDARFWFPAVGGFHVRSGSEIIITPEPDVDEDLLRLYVEGMMMASLLHQRGFFVLHASVVQVGDSAIAFLGHVGAGKSSVAAALHARGCPVVADDNAAIDLSSPRLTVLPAFPAVKIYPKIASELGYPEDSLAVMHPSQPKRARSVDVAFPQCPVPLKTIYTLARGADSGFVPLARAAYLLELIRNSVPTRWGHSGDGEHLRQCTNLAGRIPAFRVRTFDTPEELPSLALRIEQHSSRGSLGCD